MNRRKILMVLLSMLPISLFGKIYSDVVNLIKGFKVAAGETRNGEHYKMKGVTMNVLDLKVSGKDTDGALAIFEQTGLTAKGGPPLHIHPLQDEIFYVIEGEYLFQVGEERFQLKAGDTIFMPRKIKHAFVQLSEMGKLIITYQPAGKMEDFFKKTDAWISPPTKDEIAKVFEECEMKIVGPPLTLN